MSDRLSFCLVCTFYPPASFGGDAVFTHRQALGLAARGHRVRVVHNPTAHRMLGGQPGPSAEGAHPDVEVVPLPTGRLAPTATVATHLVGKPVGYRRRLGELTAGFEVVHFQNPSLLGGPGAFTAGDGESVRLYTTWEHWLVCPTHTLFRYEREVCSVRTCVRCSLHYRRPPQPWRATALMQRQVANLDALLAPSRFTAELHRQALPGVRVEVLRAQPPPTAAIEAALSRPPPPDRPYFLYAGRLEAIKGADRLARAFAAVQGADLVIAGDGTQADEVRALAEDNPSIRFLGWRPHSEVLGLARDARAVVVPSVGYETFGGAALEAMSLGTPVVVRALGPLPELVEAGGGMAVGNDAEMARALQQLADDPALARRLGDEARTVVAERFSEAAFFGRYFEIVAELLAARGRSRLSARAAAAAEAER